MASSVRLTYTSSVARKESVGRIPGKSNAYRKHVTSHTGAAPEYGHEKTMAFFRATFLIMTRA